jgi:hypothetical protein
VFAPIGADISFRDIRRTHFLTMRGTAMDDTDARTAVQESMDRRDQGESS